MVQEALKFINRRMASDGFDTVRYILGKYSEQVNQEGRINLARGE
jgi:hypothetical protein